MPVTKVTSPEGISYDVTHPEGASRDEILQFAAANYGQPKQQQAPEKPYDYVDRRYLPDQTGKTILSGGSQAILGTAAGAADLASMYTEYQAGPILNEDEWNRDQQNKKLRARTAVGGYGTFAGHMGQQILDVEGPATYEEYRREQDKRVAFQRKLEDQAALFRDASDQMDEHFGVSPEYANSFPGQVSRVLGQMPVQIATAGTAGFLMMADESIRDAEESLGIDYKDMTPEQRKKVAIQTAAYTVVGGALEYTGLHKMGLSPGKIAQIMKGELAMDKSFWWQVLKAANAEGVTEASQGALLDSLAYGLETADRDSDRFTIKEILTSRGMEYAVGAAAGSIMGAPQAHAMSQEARFRDTIERAGDGSAKPMFNVTYTEDGTEYTIPIVADSEQAAMEQVRLLKGERLDPDTPVTAARMEGVPTTSDQEDAADPRKSMPLPEPESRQPDGRPWDMNEDDLNFDDAKPLDEGADPFYQIEDTETGQRITTPSTVQIAAEIMSERETRAADEAGAQEATAPTGQGFSLPDNLKKGKPGYRGSQNIVFASDLERASYSATVKNDSPKRQKYRQLLLDAGYTEEQIDSMGTEVRAQLKSQYDAEAPTRPLNVRLPQTEGSTQPDTLGAAQRDSGTLQGNAGRTAIERNKPSTLVGNIDPELVNGRVLHQGAGRITNPDRRVLDEMTGEAGETVHYDPEHSPETASELGRSNFDAVVSPFVANVIPQDYRGQYWQDMANSLKPEGHAIVTARGDVEQNAKKKGWPKHGDGYVTGGNTFQRNYTEQQLIDEAKQFFDDVQPLRRPDGKKYPNPTIIARSPKQQTLGASPGTPSQQVAEADRRIDTYRTPEERKANAVPTDLGEGGKVRTIAKALQLPEDQRLDPTDNSTIPEATSRIKQVIAKARGRFPKFAKWYSSRLQMAMDILRQLDPALSQPENDFIMKVLLAVTSNGNKVGDQTFDSWRAYQHWKANGNLGGYLNVNGTRKATIIGHFKMVDKMIQLRGWQAVKEFLDRSGTKRELKEALVSEFGFTPKQAADLTNGELIDEQVPFAMIFGPKLGSFYNNLNGNFDTITMDRWFMRTFARTMGDQLRVSVPFADKTAIDKRSGMLKNRIERYKAAVRNLPKTSKLHNVEGGPRIKIGILPEEASFWSKYFAKEANRKNLTEEENEFRLAVNNYWKFMDGLELIEAPKNGGHRRYIREVLAPAIREFNAENGTSFTPAEIQALLWYYEKEVHDSFGSIQTDEAPDYANAANELHRSITGTDSPIFQPSDAIGTVARPDDRGGRDAPVSGSELSRTQRAGTLGASTRQSDGPVGPSTPNSPVLGLVKKYLPVAQQLGLKIVIRPIPNGRPAQYNISTRTIEINDARLMETHPTLAGMNSVIQEELIHGIMHRVVNNSKGIAGTTNFMEAMAILGRQLTADQKEMIAKVYGKLGTDAELGAEYMRMALQQLMFGEITEQHLLDGPSGGIIKRAIRQIQKYLSSALKNLVGTNGEAAALLVKSADMLQKAMPSARPVNQKLLTRARKTLKEQAGKQEIAPLDIAAHDKRGKGGFSFLEKFVYTISDVAKSIHPEINALLLKYVNGIELTVTRRQEATHAFKVGISKVKGRDARRLKQLLFYSPRDEVAGTPRVRALLAERDALLMKYGLFNLYQLEVKPLLAQIWKEANGHGVNMGQLNDYFPRLIKDLDGLLASYGRVIQRDWNSHLEAINANRPPTNKILPDSDEAAFEFEKYIRARAFQSPTTAPVNLKERQTELIDEDKLKYYADPAEALDSYIQKMTTHIATADVFGPKVHEYPENLHQAAKMGILIRDLNAKGELNPVSYTLLPELIKAVVFPKLKESQIMSTMRKFSYLTLLIEPSTTLSQLFDIPFIMTDNGPIGTLRGVLSALTNREKFALREYGIRTISQEMEWVSTGGINKFMDRSLRFGLEATGFRRLDGVMKRANLTANYNRLAKLARGYMKKPDSAKSQRFKREIEELAGADGFAEVVGDLVDKKPRSAAVRHILLAKLQGTQPITRLQMPLKVAQNPNYRALYTMRSFVITQISKTRQIALNDILHGNAQQKLRGAMKLAQLMTFLIMVGIPVDALKDFLLGRTGYMSDYIFNGAMRAFGVSKYSLYRGKSEGIPQAIFDYIAPVPLQQSIDIGGQIADIINGKPPEETKLLALLPLSDFWFYRWGPQQDREYDKMQQRWQRSQEVPVLEPDAMERFVSGLQ